MKLGPPCYVKILRVESKKARSRNIDSFSHNTSSCQYYFRNIKYLYKRYAVYSYRYVIFRLESEEK